MKVRFSKILDNTIYPRKAVAEARQAYGEYCDVKAVPVAGGGVELLFSIKEPYLGEARDVILGFLNYALDRSVQLHLEEVE